MIQNMRIWVKIVLVLGVAIISSVAVLTYFNLARLNELSHRAESSALEAQFKVVSYALGGELRKAEVMTDLLANFPLVQEKLSDGNREWFDDQFVSAFEVLTVRYDVTQLQFHSPPATSFFRAHDAGRFGDDLSITRPHVLAANRDNRPMKGISRTHSGFAALAVSPVRYFGQPVGSVEFGMGVGQVFFDTLKSNDDVNAGLYVPDNKGGFTAVGSALGAESLVSDDTLTQALNGNAQIVYTDIEGVPHTIYAADYGGSYAKTDGVIVIAIDTSAFVGARFDARRNAILVGLLSIVFGLLLAILLARHLGRRINTVIAGVDRIAEGDLSADIPLEGRDEIACLAQAASKMRGKLHSLVTEVSVNAAKVLSASEEILGAVEGQASTSSEMSSSVAEITSTMEELSASSTVIADHSTSVVDIAGQTLDGSRKSSESMEDVIARMQDISIDNQKSLKEIVDLGAKSKEIGKIMEIINAVADQTKLIAFNAALEASSAGEAGKRFSVVASEIRRLADSVSESTEEIAKKISEIQESINLLVISSEKGSSGIAAGSTASSNTAECLHEIIDAASQARSAAEQISLSTKQQKTASDQVVVALREIVTASSSTAGSINRISQNSREMSSLSTRLDELVGHFNLGEDD